MKTKIPLLFLFAILGVTATGIAQSSFATMEGTNNGGFNFNGKNSFSKTKDLSFFVVTKDQYLTKSKNQKTAAWILLGSGVLLNVVGISTYKKLNNDDFFSSLDKAVNNVGSSMLIITGNLAILGSIPLFIASGNNKRKAASISVSTQQIIQLQNNSMVSTQVPTLSLKVNL